MVKVDISSTIDALVVEDKLIKLPSYFGQLPDAEFKELKKRMTAIGGAWKTNKQGWLFKTDPTPFLEQLRAGNDVNIFQDHQFFFTPEGVFDFMINWPEQEWKLEIPSFGKDDFNFLEPEAGEGHIIDYFHKQFSITKNINIFCCESMPRNIEILKAKGYGPFCDDFLKLKGPMNGFFDLIIANPPFSNNQYIDHIYKMYDVTKEGGTILTIAPDNYSDSNDPKRVEFRDWLRSVHAMEKPVPKKLFRENKAGAKTNVIWIDVLYS